MKRLMVALGIVLLAGAIAIPVFARGPSWGGGPMTGYGPGAMMGYRGGYSGYGPPGTGYAPLTDDQRKQLDTLHRKFYDETATLRSQL